MILTDRLDQLRRFLTTEIWTREGGARAVVAWGWSALQLVVLVGQGFVQDHLLLRASALTYFTMLSLIPMIAIAFSMVGALGVSENLAEVIVDRIAAGSPEAGQKILEILQHVNFASLGGVGATILFVTTVLALSNVEKALNAIWGVRRERSLLRRFPDYLAVLVVAPLLLGLAVSLGTTLRSEAGVEWLLGIPGFAELYRLGLRHAPFAFLVLGFAFLYWFLPNTQVKVSSALFGGLVSSALFLLAQGVYVGFQVGVARSNAVFGTFSALPLLLVWIYLSWLIVLLGAEVAFASQHLSVYRRRRRGDEPSPAAREALGLAIAVRAARRFQQGGAALTAESLAEELGVSTRAVRDVMASLEGAGILAARGDPERDGFQLGRAAERISAGEVFRALRGSPALAWGELPEADVLQPVLAALERCHEEVLQTRTLTDLAGGAVDRVSAAR